MSGKERSEAPDIVLDSASEPQEKISAEIEAIHDEYRRARDSGAPEELGSRLDFPPYRSSILRHPTKALVQSNPEKIELYAPVFGDRDIDSTEADLTAGHPGEPIGERIIFRGRIVDADGRPVRRQLVEVWQANAAGRYAHQRDQHPAPLDPNFTGAGRTLTDGDGWYEFLSIRPGPYPWRNHHNAWRPAHIHFSLFGTAFTQRLVTQMYFPGDPLFALDPICQSIPDAAARERLVARYDHGISRHEWATGYRWDIVLAGAHRTVFESEVAEEGDHDA